MINGCNNYVEPNPNRMKDSQSIVYILNWTAKGKKVIVVYHNSEC